MTDAERRAEPFTWDDVNWLRREAAREERHAERYRSRGSEYIASNVNRAERYRSLADRIERALQTRAA